MVTTGSQSEGTAIELTDSNGTVLVSAVAEREFSCVILSHPSIVQGETYTLTVGSSGTTITMDSTVYGSGGMGTPGGSGGAGGGMEGGTRGRKDSGSDGGTGEPGSTEGSVTDLRP